MGGTLVWTLHGTLHAVYALANLLLLRSTWSVLSDPAFPGVGHLALKIVLAGLVYDNAVRVLTPPLLARGAAGARVAKALATLSYCLHWCGLWGLFPLAYDLGRAVRCGRGAPGGMRAAMYGAGGAALVAGAVDFVFLTRPTASLAVVEHFVPMVRYVRGKPGRGTGGLVPLATTVASLVAFVGLGTVVWWERGEPGPLGAFAAVLGLYALLPPTSVAERGREDPFTLARHLLPNGFEALLMHGICQCVSVARAPCA